MEKIHILVIEDDPLLREGLAAMLEEQPDLRVTASGTADAVRIVQRLKLHVILLDVGMRTQTSLRLVGLLKSSAPGAKVIAMGLAAMQQEVVRFVEAGVSGFVLKDTTFDRFLRTIRSVARGDNVLPPLLADSLFARVVQYAGRTRKDTPSAAIRLTRREREVISLIAAGMSNKEIAVRLHLAVDTVKSHVRTILKKLAFKTRLEIAAYAQTDKDYRDLPPFTTRD